MVKTPGASTARRGCLARDPALCLELSLLLSASLPRGLLTSPLAFRKHTKHASVVAPSYPLLLCQENSSRYLPDSLPQCLLSPHSDVVLWWGFLASPCHGASPPSPPSPFALSCFGVSSADLTVFQCAVDFTHLCLWSVSSPVFGRLGSEPTPVLAHGAGAQ